MLIYNGKKYFVPVAGTGGGGTPIILTTSSTGEDLKNAGVAFIKSSRRVLFDSSNGENSTIYCTLISVVNDTYYYFIRPDTKQILKITFVSHSDEIGTPEFVGFGGGEVPSDLISSVEELKNWMENETYTNMKVTLSFQDNYSLTEYGTRLTSTVIDYKIDKETSSAYMILPSGEKKLLANKEPNIYRYYTDGTRYLLTGSLKWKIEATRKDGKQEKITSDTLTISPVYRVYWGVGTQADEFDGAFVTGLRPQGTGLVTSRSRTISFDSIDNKYVYYAYPKTLGSATFQIGEFPLAGSFEAPVTINVDTGLRDDAENPVMLDYYLYRSSNLLKDAETVNVYVK